MYAHTHRGALAAALVLVSSLTVTAQEGGGVRRARQPIRGHFIVVLAGQDDPEAVALETERLSGGRLKHVYRSALRGFAIRMPQPAAEALARDPRVRFVEEDATVRASQAQVSPPWGLDRVDQRLLPLDGQYRLVSPGTTVTVHVLDTGIRTSHQEFQGRASIAGDYVDDDGDGDPADLVNDDANAAQPDGEDCNGHGTHVAGTIGGATSGVAKNVVLRGHRVLACDGGGSLSGVIAAIDAITSDATRPAVANMSLGGGPSTALDDAVRRSIAAGVTYVVAAGNENVDASNSSPARVLEAITVGATTSTDARASFSNFGPALDLFAPGASIASAWWTSDTAVGSLSGTSMATPHAAGVAALYLERNPTRSPAQVAAALIAEATLGRVTNAGTGSANRLLYSAFLASAPPTLALTRPDGGERVFTGTPYTIRWTASDDEGLAGFDLHASADGGVTYTPIAGCTSLSGAVRSCTWTAPGPVTSKARIKVVARDVSGASATDASAANFTIASGTAVVTVTAPNSAVNWGRGSTQQIRWSHNLGGYSYVRIEFSADGGATYQLVADSVRNTSSSSGVYDWRVPGPNTSGGLVRISWLDGPAADVSNVGFTIADSFLTISSPTSSSTRWGYGTLQRPQWLTNLGPGDRVAIGLSVDGGATFPTSLAADVTASAKYADVTTPVLGAPVSGARVRLTWTNAPAGLGVVAVSPTNFVIEPASVAVVSPNGGETLTAGTSPTVRWTSNLGPRELVRVELSTDGGLTYPVVLLPTTSSDGAQSALMPATAVTAAGRIRLVWTRNSAVADASNANFRVQ